MQSERLMGRLRGVRRRKRARKGFACQVLAAKLTLVRDARRGSRRVWKA